MAISRYHVPIFYAPKIGVKAKETKLLEPFRQQTAPQEIATGLMALAMTWWTGAGHIDPTAQASDVVGGVVTPPYENIPNRTIN